MDVKFYYPRFHDMIKDFLSYIDEDTMEDTIKTLHYYYFDIDVEYTYTLNYEEQTEYLYSILKDVYIKQEALLKQKVTLFETSWKKYQEQITNALSKAFHYDTHTCFNDLHCCINIHPLMSHDLVNHRFDIFYLEDEKGMIGYTIHELIHFLWFDLWHKTFHDDFREYDTPSLKWISSELILVPIMNDECLHNINPFFICERTGEINETFYDLKINNQYILQIIDDMYHQYPIQEFMKHAYQFVQSHEEAIRQHIYSSQQ